MNKTGDSGLGNQPDDPVLMEMADSIRGLSQKELMATRASLRAFIRLLDSRITEARAAETLNCPPAARRGSPP